MSWRARRSRRTVALLASIAPIKPRGSPPWFRTSPPRLHIYSLRHQSPEPPTPIWLPPSSLHPHRSHHQARIHPLSRRFNGAMVHINITPQRLDGLIRHSPSWSGGCLVMRTSHHCPKGMSCPLLSSMSGDSSFLPISFFGGCWITTRWSAAS